VLGRGEVRDGDCDVVEHPAEATVAGVLESMTHASGFGTVSASRVGNGDQNADQPSDRRRP